MSSAAQLQDHLKFSGELRYRLAQSKESADDPRTLHRFRLRLGLEADVNDAIRAIVRLGTATSAISGNQTMADKSDPGMPRRSIGIERAYMDWTLAKDTTLWLGRTPVPFWAPGRSQLLWDNDLAFEGFAFKWRPQWSSSGMFLILGTSLISENYDSTGGHDMTDVELLGGQAGYIWKGERHEVTIHVAHQYFTNLKDSNITRLASGASKDSHTNPFVRYRGNSAYASGSNYFLSEDFALLETGLEWKLRGESDEWTLFANGVRNLAVSVLNDGWEAGIGYKRGKFWAGTAHVRKQADSVVGAFSDSNSNGGGTDNDGQRIWIGYEILPSTTFQVQQFFAERGIDSTRRQFQATFIDLMATF